MKIKGYGRTAKFITQKVSYYQKKKFEKIIQGGELKPGNSQKVNLNFDLTSVCGDNHYSNLVLSILSFLENVGEPPRWYVFSDGTLSKAHRDTITKMFPFVEVFLWSDLECIEDSSKPIWDRYLDWFPMAKKTFVVMNFKSSRPFLYADSDIIFYRKFSDYIDLFNRGNSFYYMVDNGYCCLDTEYMKTHINEMFQLNAGFLFILPNVDWQPALDYLKTIRKEYSFFDQTAFHINFMSILNKVPLDPRTFCVEMRDHFKFSVIDGRNRIVVRHFVGPIRHKMWQKGWKWHLK